MTIIDFVESLNDEIHHFDLNVKKNGLQKLSKYLSEISFYTTNAATVDCLVTFYVNLLTEHYELLNSVLEGILVLIDFSEFSDIHAHLVATCIVQIDVSQLNVSVRILIFDVLEQLFLHHATGMQSLNVEFIREYMTAINGESDPQCVLRVMRINTNVAETLNIESIYEELFESVSVYFPIEFKTNKSTGLLTRTQLVEANKRSMLSSPLFGAQLFVVIMEKLTSETKSARLDSLEILAEAIIKMNFDDVLNYYLTFIDLLHFQYKTNDEEIRQLVEKCLKALSLLLQRKASEKQLLEFCWRLFEQCHSAVSNDKDVIHFIFVCIKDKPRVWSGFLAYFLPKVMERSLKEDLEDLERLDHLTSILSACSNPSQYKGLLDNETSKIFFTKVSHIYYQIDEFSKSPEDNKTITVLYKLLSVYSLFNITLPESCSEYNFLTESDLVVKSQVSLVSKAVNYVAICGNEELESAMIDLVPKMIEMNNKPLDNNLVNLIVHLSESESIVQSHISYLILRSFPVLYIDVVLNQVINSIKSNVLRESATSCLAVLIERFNIDCNVSTRLSVVLTDVVEYLLESKEEPSVKSTENIALAIANLGPTRNEISKVQMLDSLLKVIHSAELNFAAIIWLCSAVGELSIEIISKSIKAGELLHILFGLNVLPNNSQIIPMVCKTFGSIINKSTNDKEAEAFTLSFLPAIKNDSMFLFYILKASVYSGQKEIISKVIDIITSTDGLLTSCSQSLINNIQILSKSNDTITHFCNDTKLFPTQTLFYEQQIFHLLAQRYQNLAMSSSYDLEIRSAAMSLYLMLMDGFSEEIIEMSLNEMVSTISSYLPVLSTSTNKVSLKAQILKSLTNLRSMEPDIDLSPYVEDIIKIILSVSDQLTLLSIQQKLSFVKSIACFSKDLQRECSTSSMETIRCVIMKLKKDRKRVVRIETAKTALFLFE